MDITFASEKLKRQLSDAKQLQKAFGDRAKRVRLRLDFLKAAPALADVPVTPPTRRHELSGNWTGHFAVDVTANDRLIFRPANEPVPLKEDGGIDLMKVTAIEITAVEDYH
jgi:plasmid maintenance system killer protein